MRVDGAGREVVRVDLVERFCVSFLAARLVAVAAFSVATLALAERRTEAFLDFKAAARAGA